ncbi:hypothetical protein BgiMline_021021 [Biomphalaria glabrata]
MPRNILIYVCQSLLISLLLSDARPASSGDSERNVSTELCPTPRAPLNGDVSCDYSDAVQINIDSTAYVGAATGIRER